jgi:hypothetical protein
VQQALQEQKIQELEDMGARVETVAVEQITDTAGGGIMAQVVVLEEILEYVIVMAPSPLTTVYLGLLLWVEMAVVVLQQVVETGGQGGFILVMRPDTITQQVVAVEEQM